MIAAVNFGQGITDAFSSVASFVPKLLAFLVILVIGFVVAKMISKVLSKALTKVGFDRAVERGGIKKMLSHSNYDASDIVAKIVYYAIALFVLQAAFGVFGPNPVSLLLASVVGFLPKVFAAILVIVVASAIATAVREVISVSLGGLSYGKTLANAAGGVVVAVGVFAALNQVQIAEPIVNGLFYAILAALVGIAIVAVGGAGVRPMQSRWDNVLRAYDAEKDNFRNSVAGSRERLDQRKEELKSDAQQENKRRKGNGQSGDADFDSRSRNDIGSHSSGRPDQRRPQ